MAKQKFARFTPDIHLKDIYEIDLNKLKEKGIKVILFDLDNTVTLHRSPRAEEKAIDWFSRLPQFGLKAGIISNNSGSRVEVVAQQLNIPYIADAKKPSQSGFLRAFELFGIKAEECAMVGDQLFTDIAGGKRAGVFTILVVPIGRDEHWGTRNISRRFERLLWKQISKDFIE